MITDAWTVSQTNYNSLNRVQILPSIASLLRLTGCEVSDVIQTMCFIVVCSMYRILLLIFLSSPAMAIEQPDFNVLAEAEGEGKKYEIRQYLSLIHI